MTKTRNTPDETTPTNPAPADELETGLSNPEPQPEPALETEPASQPATPGGPSFAQRLGRLLVFLLKLIFLLFLFAVLGAGIYFGWPLFYDQYIRPVQENTARLGQLDIRQQQDAAHVAALETQAAGLLTEQARLLSEQTRLNQLLQSANTRLDALESHASTQDSRLDALNQTQTALQSDSQDLKAELGRQIKLLRAMELLSRARLYLYQSNFGMARQDLLTAHGLLAEVQPLAPEPLAGQLTEVTLRLDLALARLPDYPVTASDDLDIAWQVLLEGLPPVLPIPPTPSAAPTELPTVAPTAASTAAPTATPATPATPAPPAATATLQATLQATLSPDIHPTGSPTPTP